MKERVFHLAHPTRWAESISILVEMVYCTYVGMSVRHHFKDDQKHCSKALQTPITMHILKAYEDSYSKIIRDHEDRDKDDDKDTDKVSETPNICYIFELLTTHSFQI